MRYPELCSQSAHLVSGSASHHPRYSRLSASSKSDRSCPESTIGSSSRLSRDTSALSPSAPYIPIDIRSHWLTASTVRNSHQSAAHSDSPPTSHQFHKQSPIPPSDTIRVHSSADSAVFLAPEIPIYFDSFIFVSRPRNRSWLKDAISVSLVLFLRHLPGRIILNLRLRRHQSTSLCSSTAA